MTIPKRNSRKIIINNEVFRWYLKNNRLDDGWPHIAIQHSVISGQVILFDPFHHNLSGPSPRLIREVILFALEHGWTPTLNGAPIYIGYDGERLFTLPKGQQHAYDVLRNRDNRESL